MSCEDKEIKLGISIEMKEHGFSKKISEKIARDHIKKDPKYYSKYKSRKSKKIKRGKTSSRKIYRK